MLLAGVMENLSQSMLVFLISSNIDICNDALMRINKNILVCKKSKMNIDPNPIKLRLIFATQNIMNV